MNAFSGSLNQYFRFLQSHARGCYQCNQIICNMNKRTRPNGFEFHAGQPAKERPEHTHEHEQEYAFRHTILPCNMPDTEP